MIAVKTRSELLILTQIVGKGNWMVGGLLAIISTGAFATELAFAIMALKTGTFVELATLKTLSMACNITSAAADSLISVVLVYYLYISKTGFNKTDDMINRLIAFTFNTGISPPFLIIRLVVDYRCHRGQINKVYTNTLLVTLNTRDYVRLGGSLSEEPYNTLSQTGIALRDRSALAIRIETTKITDQIIFTPHWERTTVKAPSSAWHETCTEEHAAVGQKDGEGSRSSIQKAIETELRVLLMSTGITILSHTLKFRPLHIQKRSTSQTFHVTHMKRPCGEPPVATRWLPRHAVRVAPEMTRTPPKMSHRTSPGQPPDDVALRNGYGATRNRMPREPPGGYRWLTARSLLSY
ncbi:hypothetical protein B0H14DRAFT_2641879 [Mycena olivaceomarginata]|nr:hypothetical protein B0H14DRAFT_2641879 [Mycena olivaceomarginata]